MLKCDCSGGSLYVALQSFRPLPAGAQGVQCLTPPLRTV